VEGRTDVAEDYTERRGEWSYEERRGAMDAISSQCVAHASPSASAHAHVVRL
jgi:hypothetical protein